MTIPIIPGPFSFLASAGQAAGAIGTEVQQAKERRRKQAQDNINNLMALINSGRASVAILNKPAAMAEFRAAGIPIPQTVNLELGAPGGAGMGAPGIPISLHTPDTFTPSADDRIQQMTRDALAGPLTPQQQSAVTKVPTPAAAAAAETTAVAGANTARANARTNVAQADVAEASVPGEISAANFKKEVFNGALISMGNDPAFRHLAEEAAAGVLQARITALQMSRASLTENKQREHDQAVFISGMENDIDTSFNKAAIQWTTGQQAAVQQAVSNSQLTDKPIDINDPTQIAPVLREYESRQPRPNYEDVRDRYLSARGFTLGSYQAALKGIAPLLGIGSGPAQGTTQAAPRPQRKLTYDEQMRAVTARILESLGTAKPDGSGAVWTPEAIANELVNPANKVSYNRDQLITIVNFLRARAPNPESPGYPLIEAISARIAHAPTPENASANAARGQPK